MADQLAFEEPSAKKQKLSSESSEKTLKILVDGAESDKPTSLKISSHASGEKPEEVALDGDGKIHSSSEVQHVDSGEKECAKTEIRPCNKATSASEKEVGILEFVSSLPGFYGVLKQRYTDFIVSERDLQGHLVRLKDISVPQDEKTTEFDLNILSEEDKEKVQQVVDDEEKKSSATLSPDDDKDHRRLVHRAIKAKFPCLDSDTVDVDGQKAVRVFHKRNSNNRRRDARWPSELGQYCRFVLYKENKDTMDAINLLSKLLKVKAGIFGYAGTKDRRAVTTQQVSVFRVQAEQLQDLNGILRNMCLGNFKYSKEPLKLGALSGNHFVITLRNVVGDHAKIDESLESLKANGFINYFGLQRFGTTSVPTHKIGQALLLSRWSEAVDLLLNPREGEPDDLSAARQYWKSTRDAKETLKRLPKQKCIESDLLQGLARFGPSDPVNALNCLPRNTRLMYVHAYQSYVWNHMASRRIKEHGLQPIKGDLVATSASAGCHDSTDTSEREEAPTVEFLPEPSRSKVSALTEEDLKSGRYTIHDVVLPLPGYDVVYPDNELKDHYTQIMSNDGLDINNMRNKVRDYSLSGAYRKLIVKPSAMSWRWLRYNDVKEPLALTDTGRLQGDQEPRSVPDGKYWALQMEFTLPTSTYATMALREVLRCDTSSAYQSTLNQD